MLYDLRCVISGPVVEVMNMAALLDQMRHRGGEDVALVEPRHESLHTEVRRRCELIGEGQEMLGRL
jgi:hypothetical protein